MTACSGLSTPDSESPLSGTPCESAMFLARDRMNGTICDLNREEEYGQRAIRWAAYLRGSIQEETGPWLPVKGRYYIRGNFTACCGVSQTID